MRRMTPWQTGLGGFVFLLLGVFFTASIFLSPKLELVGIVTGSRIAHWRGINSYHLTLEQNGKRPKDFKVAHEIYEVAKTGSSSLRVVYRAWDDDATEIEIVSGPGRRRNWKRGILDDLVGPGIFILGFGLLWVAFSEWKAKRRRSEIPSPPATYGAA